MAGNGTAASAETTEPIKHEENGEAQNTMETTNKSTLLSATTWDIYAPPASNSIKGKMVPKAVIRFKNRRKLSVEVHRVTPPVDGELKKGQEPPSYEECVIRILVPSTKSKQSSNQTFASSGDSGMEDDDDVDDESTTLGDGILADSGGMVFDGWKPKYRVPLTAVTIKKQYKKSVFIYFEVMKLKQERELIFDSLEDSLLFINKVETEAVLEKARLKRRLEIALGDIKLPPFETITLLVEIVSGWDLPIGDLTTSDPYVICKLGPQELHRTKQIPNTLDPIWTLKTDSLFLMKIASKDLFLNGGLSLLLKDYDQFGHNDLLGIVNVPPAKLYQGNGERMEFKVQPGPGTEANPTGYLAVRCRRATEYDQTFMKRYKERKEIIETMEHPTTPTGALRSIVSKHSRIEKSGIKKFKIRPNPDPQRVEQTEWMSNEEIQVETMKESQHWIDAGTGDLGTIYLEILGCNDLPNLDSGGFLGNKTDTFVSVVYEDVYARTDVIDDCLKPRWMPWTKRAFLLHMKHPSSQIFLAAFDYDNGAIADHDMIGRVSVDLSNLKKDTEYILTYNLYKSARVKSGDGRKGKGGITIRLRIETPDERKLALQSLNLPENVFINVKDRRDFRVLRQTIIGKYDIDRFSLDIIWSYIGELEEYQYALWYIQDALASLVFWRGHFSVKIVGKSFKLPIHSFNAFIVAVVLVEYPQYYPSFCFACIAWILIAIMGYRRSTANVWDTCWSYVEMVQKVAIGESRSPPDIIKSHERWEEAEAALKAWKKRKEEAIAQAEKDAVKAQEEADELAREEAEIGEANADISTKTGTGIIGFGPLLFPYQLQLGELCRLLRKGRNVVTWDEPYLAFWIASGSAILAIVCLFIPWFFIIRWTSRILVWTLLGPWMKLVDIFYVQTLKVETEEERKKREVKERHERRLQTSERASQARQVREDAAKLKQMKKYMFGKYAMRVPTLKEDRFTDLPLPQSTATAYKQKALSLAELAMQEAGYNRTRLQGQNLIGDMIPTVDTKSLTAAPVGKATANPDLLAKSTPGSGNQKKSDSTAIAYAKIGSTVVAAGVLTFIGVPIIASAAESILSKLQGKLMEEL